MKNENQRSTKNDVNKLAELIKEIKVAMLTTISEDGKIHSRPMATQQTEFDGNLWFFTDKTTHKVKELNRNHQVQLSYVSPNNHKFVSIVGQCQLVQDPEKAKQLWNPMYKAWFPKGLEDPNIGLLKVEVEQAEYWDTPSGPVVHLIGFAKAMLSGKPYADEGSAHKKLNLTH
jgi:general stress protein 26